MTLPAIRLAYPVCQMLLVLLDSLNRLGPTPVIDDDVLKIRVSMALQVMIMPSITYFHTRVNGAVTASMPLFLAATGKTVKIKRQFERPPEPEPKQSSFQVNIKQSFVEELMQKHFSFLSAILLLGTATAFAGNVGVDLNVNIGTPPPQQVIVREQAPPPSREIIIEEDIDFIYPEQLGFYVAVGVPYDLFYLRNQYYMYRGGQWYRGPHHRGPWASVHYRQLPPGLRRHKLDRVRYYRDHEYVTYERERDHYRGQHFRSGKEGRKEQRREEKRERKEEKRHDKEERKHNKGGHGDN